MRETLEKSPKNYKLKEGVQKSKVSLKALHTLHKKSISIINMGQGKLRIVTHLDYTSQMHEIVLKTLSELEVKKR